ncbi:MAG TPA: hypothetical protein VLT17_08185 [Gemmatimonadales bacterium]|jgi:hypothetical protein|nr:hypothetical protein [Gemmatimonadales bacterium]
MTAEAAYPPKKGWRTKTKLVLWTIVLTPILLFTLYTLFTLNFAYSEGFRAGVLLKFSHKGWVCKTWEGEVAQFVVAGVSPSIFEFSVRKDTTAKQLEQLLGKKVTVHYREHRGVPTTCFAATNYFVDSVAVLEEGSAPAATP